MCSTTTTNNNKGSLAHCMRKKSYPCKICGQSAFYTYYGVRCCEGCKQFFRRIVVKKKDYCCSLAGKGICAKENGRRCLGCRLDQCLLAGMRPRMLNLLPNDREWHPFVHRLEARRRHLLGAMKLKTDELKMQKAPFLLNVNDWHKLNLLLLCEERQKGNWDGWTEPPAWITHFESVEHLLHFPGNFLTPSRYQQSNVCRSQFMGTAKFIAECTFPSTAIGFICVDALMLLEWARAMPAFAQLKTSDQLLLLKHIYEPFAGLFTTFYSAQCNAETWTRANGHAYFSPKYYGELWADDKIQFMGKRYFCAGLNALRQIVLQREEFALLLAIICCSSTASGLSDAGRDLLYEQSADYCRILFKLQQNHYGAEAGVKKYADCMRLLELMFCLQHRAQLLVEYINLLKTIRGIELPRSEYPKALSLFSSIY